MSKKLIYAGIGSRKTPTKVLNQMVSIGEGLANWTLRSGHAEGADQAFELGCLTAVGKMEIYVPWFGFNGAPPMHPDYIRPRVTQEMASVAAQFHPCWNRCSDATKLMHIRNVCQIAGQELDTAATMVVCWTPDGKRGGGTSQALRIAEYLSIPIFDLAVPGADIALCDFVTQQESI